ncbi:MAG: thiol reductant ABC exporter subunit CydD [Chlorobiaceae bacterium]|jgi:ATP-binding cassette, subfamily C, bacterial CydD|nr:thiol reductant ABC exporter subunit CydD [Chlorobiaceae bacterium]
MNIDRRLFQLLKKEKSPFVLSVISGSMASVMLIVQAYYLSRIVNAAFIDKWSMNRLMPFLALFALFSILRMLFTWVSHVKANRGSSMIREKLFSRFTSRVADLGPLYSRSVQSGRLSNTMLKGIEALDAYYSSYIPQIFFALFTPVLIVCAIFTVDLISGIILLLSAPLIPFFMIVIGKRASAVTEKQWKTMSRMSGHFLDMLQGLPTLKLFAQSRSQRKRIEETGENFRKATMKVLKIAFLSSLTLELVGTIGTAVIAVSIGMRMMSGQLSFQQALFVLVLTPDFYLPLRQLGTKFHAGMEGVSASREIFDVLDHGASLSAAAKDCIEESAASGQSIVFSGISYTYPSGTHPAIDALSLTLPAGKTTALVGPSGAGKSTLINLLLRFLEPSNGSITISGKAVNRIALEAWHRQISWVPQHPYLFNATLRENIMIARQGASATELETALEKTGLAGFVSSLPDGLETVIGEQGARLSGGEAQRVALARAFLKNAPILVLDEPTSHTDPELEAGLRRSMQSLMNGRTTVIIAHRLETIRDADQILVVIGGKITQSGTHDELVRADGFYRDSLYLQKEAGV